MQQVWTQAAASSKYKVPCFDTLFFLECPGFEAQGAAGAATGVREREKHTHDVHLTEKSDGENVAASSRCCRKAGNGMGKWWLVRRDVRGFDYHYAEPRDVR
jgi:hypothetical protein